MLTIIAFAGGGEIWINALAGKTLKKVIKQQGINNLPSGFELEFTKNLLHRDSLSEAFWDRSSSRLENSQSSNLSWNIAGVVVEITKYD